MSSTLVVSKPARLFAQSINQALLTKLTVKGLLENLPNIVLGARICYSSKTLEQLEEEYNRKTFDQHLKYLIRLATQGHFSVFGHGYTVIEQDFRAVYNILNQYASPLSKIVYRASDNLLLVNVRFLVESLVSSILSDGLTNHTEIEKKLQELIFDTIHKQDFVYQTNKLQLESSTVAFDEILNDIDKNFLLELEELLKVLISDDYELYAARAYKLSNQSYSDKYITVFINTDRIAATHIRTHTMLNHTQRSFRYTKAKLANLRLTLSDIRYAYKLYKQNSGKWKDFISWRVSENKEKLIRYNYLLSIGYPREDARAELSEFIGTTVAITGLQTFFQSFFMLRLDSNAQWNTRAAALAIQKLL